MDAHPPAPARSGWTAERGYGLLAMALCIVPVTSQLFQATRPVFMPSWGITEWLISYDAGFVRRGLTGEIVEAIAVGLRVAPSFVIAMLSAIIFAAALGIAIRVARGKLPLWLLLSPLAFGMPMAAGFIVRKDLLVVVLFAACLAGLHRLDRPWARIALVNAVSIVGVLSHEIYIFAALPLLALSMFPAQAPVRRIVFGGLSLVPSAAAAFAMVIYKGTAQQGLALTAHWNAVLERVAPSWCCYTKPESEFDALGWSVDDLWAQSVRVLHQLDGIFWAPLMWLITLAFVGLMLALFFRPRRAGGKQALLAIFAVQTASFLPMFLSAVDFGRWTFLISATSLIAASMWDDAETEPAPLFAGWMPKLPDLEGSRRWLAPAILLGFAVPACCWSTNSYLLTTLIGRNVDSLGKLAELLQGRPAP